MVFLIAFYGSMIIGLLFYIFAKLMIICYTITNKKLNQNIINLRNEIRNLRLELAKSNLIIRMKK